MPQYGDTSGKYVFKRNQLVIMAMRPEEKATTHRTTAFFLPVLSKSMPQCKTSKPMRIGSTSSRPGQGYSSSQRTAPARPFAEGPEKCYSTCLLNPSVGLMIIVCPPRGRSCSLGSTAYWRRNMARKAAPEDRRMTSNALLGASTAGGLPCAS